MTNLPPSNLPFLKKTFSDIIQNDMDSDQTGRTSSSICQRKLLFFMMVLFCLLLNSSKTEK